MTRTHSPPKLALKQPIEDYDCPASREVRRLMGRDDRYSADVADDTVRLLASLRDRFGPAYREEYMPYVEIDDDFRDSVMLEWALPGRNAGIYVLPDADVVRYVLADGSRPMAERLQSWNTDHSGLRDAAHVTRLGSFLAGTA